MMNRISIIRRCIVSFLCCLAAGKTFAQYDSLTYQLTTIFTKDSLPGMCVMLTDTSGTIYHKNFGFADIAAKKPYTENNVQNIGSVSKTVISLAVMKAVELGYFTLDDDINSILPFKVVNPYNPTQKITVRQLTNHTSGIIDNPAIYLNTLKFRKTYRPYDASAMGLLGQYGYNEKINDTSMRQFFYNYLSPGGRYYSDSNYSKTGAGPAYLYSNVGSALAAYLVEVKSGITYAAFTQKYIFKPLQMDHTGWVIDTMHIEQYGQLYFNHRLTLPLYTLLTYPDGGVRTTPADLSKYVKAILKGYYGDTTILSAASFKTLFTPIFSTTRPPANINMQKRNKGVFWNLYNDGNFSQDGDDPGISTYVFINPSKGIAGLFMMNEYMPDKQPLVDALAKAVNSH